MTNKNNDVIEHAISQEIAECHKYLEDLMLGHIDQEDIANADFLSDIQKDWLSRQVNKCHSYTWGLDCIDAKITTPKRGQLILMVADENAGKSTFAYFFSRANKEKYKHNVAYYSLEMTKDEMIDNLARQSANITKLQFRDNEHLTNLDYQTKKRELETREDINFVGKKASEVTTLDSVISEVRELKDLDFLIIDNLSCLKQEDRDTNSDMQTKVVALIALARELNIPIILVHHYRKSGGGKTNLFKSTADVKGGGILKDLVPIIIQVTRNPDLEDEKVQDEFYIREGKLRGGSKRETVMVRHDRGGFVEDRSGF